MNRRSLTRRFRRGPAILRLLTRTAWRNAAVLPLRRGVVLLQLHLHRGGGEYRDTVNEINGGERYVTRVYNIDYNRCIFCGYCVEACPTDAITHGHGFEQASYNTSTLIYHKEDMLAPIPPGAKPPVVAPATAGGREQPVETGLQPVGRRHHPIGMFRTIREQLETIFREDPAAKSTIEIVLSISGISTRSIWHRLQRIGSITPRFTAAAAR